MAKSQDSNAKTAGNDAFKVSMLQGSDFTRSLLEKVLDLDSWLFRSPVIFLLWNHVGARPPVTATANAPIMKHASR